MEQRGEQRDRRKEEPLPGREERAAGKRRAPGRAELAARALLEGAPPERLDPEGWKQLSGRIGNSGLEAFLAARLPRPELHGASSLVGEADTAPFPAPADGPWLAEPRELTREEPGGQGFPTAWLRADGGASGGPAL